MRGKGSPEPQVLERGVAWISRLTTGKICRWRRGAFDGCRRVMNRRCFASSSGRKLSKFYVGYSFVEPQVPEGVYIDS